MFIRNSSNLEQNYKPQRTKITSILAEQCQMGGSLPPRSPSITKWELSKIIFQFPCSSVIYVDNLYVNLNGQIKKPTHIIYEAIFIDHRGGRGLTN